MTTARLAHYIEAWKRLAENAIEPNPFYEPEYLMASARELEGEDIRCLAVFRDGSRHCDLIGLFPMKRASLIEGAIIPALEFYRNDYICLTTPLIDKDDPVGVWQCFFDSFAISDQPRIALSRLMPENRGAYAALEEALHIMNRPCAVVSSHERAAVENVTDFAVYTAAYGSKRLKDVRRRQRRLNEMGAIQIRTVTQPEDKRAAFAEFLRVEASGWKGQEGTAMGCNPATSAFAQSAFLADNAQFDMVTLDGKVIAITACLLRNGALYTVKTAYDEAFSAASPGTMLDIFAIGNLAKYPRRYSRLDSCAIAGHSVESLWLQREPILSLVIGAHPAVTESRVESVASTLRNVQRLRRWVKEQIRR